MGSKKFLALGIFCLLVLSGIGNALEGSYMYVSLSYGRGWHPWACFTEKGMKGISFMECPDVGPCPFEESMMYGSVTCGPFGLPLGKGVLPPVYGIVARISVPEDLKLVTLDDHAVEDELCVGDVFKLSKGTKKGEWWSDGGHYDSPPIYWVDDVEKLVLDMMSYHEATNTEQEDVCKDITIQNGFVDPLFNIPLYTTSVSYNKRWTAYPTGNVVCSIKEKNFDVSGSVEQRGDNYEVTKNLGDSVKFNGDFMVECFYYYFGGTEGVMSSYPELPRGPYYCCDNYAVFHVPTIIQAGPHATQEDWDTHNIKYNSISDFFKVGTIGINKTIKVVEPANVSVKVSTIFDEDKLFSGKETTFKVKVKNEGNAGIKIKDVSSNVEHEFVVCDSEKVNPGEEGECILKVTAQDLSSGVSISVDYEYESCGRRKEGEVSESLFESVSVKSEPSTQVYQMTVKGDCENEYYACDTPNKDGKFYAGYKCFNRDPFFVPTKERFNLKFDLSSLPSDAEILGAKLYLHVSEVNKAQEVGVYSVSNKWAPKLCEPGGDICLKPYCKECSPLFELEGNLVESQEISNEGWYTVDVRELVKEKDRVSVQVRGEKEDKVWSELGKDSCGKKEQWDHYDVVFSGEGAEKPYLRIVYK